MSATPSMFNGRELAGQTLARLEVYRQLDGERDNLIQFMIQKIDNDERKIQELQLDLDDQKKSRMEYQSSSRTFELELERLNSKLRSGSFVVVLVDGDGAKFRDEFLRDYEQGAARAARKLKEAVQELGFGYDMPILVRVYANINDLARALRYSGIVDTEDSLRHFAEQFTNTHADCDFINVGKGKENGDSKIRRLLDHYHKNEQCEKVFVACCHDTGYLHDLRQYAGTPACKIRLIETTPAEPVFRNLDFPIDRFDGVFRTEPLNNETKRGPPGLPFITRSPVQINPGPIGRPIQTAFSDPVPAGSQEQRKSAPLTSTIVSPIQSISTPSTNARERPPSVSSAPDKSPAQAIGRPSNIVSSGNGGTSISYAMAGGSTNHQNITVKVAKPKKEVKYAFYNENHQRLDPPTQHPPRTPAQTTYQAKFQTIKPLVFCNDHYLKGRCPRGAKCDKEHEVQLTDSEVAIHRYKARTSLCPNGPLCNDNDCYLSHHCPRSPCTRPDQCPFSHTTSWGDLHYTKEQMVAKSKWDGNGFPEQIHTSA
ncbi:hypothetical protein F4808DRAFT_346188 [Astrocystis sublimbata]|nr:hypothetical protein F4808DRAFT_346188 [Astrocystis sublimbata]